MKLFCAIIANATQRIVVAMVLLVLPAGCASASSPDISNLVLETDTSFSGTLQAARWQPITVTWDSAPLEPSEGYVLKLRVPGGHYVFSSEFDGSNNFEQFNCFWSNTCKLTVDGVHHKLTVQLDADMRRKGISVGWFLISMGSGSNAALKLQKVAGSSVVAEAESLWTRPARTERPANPILVNSWKYHGDGYAEYSIRDGATYSFESFPTRAFGKCTGVCDSEEPLAGELGARSDIWNWNVKGMGVEVAFWWQVANELGKSDRAELKIVSGSNPCAKRLAISVVGDWRSTCGRLEVTVIQADLNTSECKFLGEWRDSTGVSRLGMFHFCESFTSGSFSEGRSYSISVTVGDPVEYQTATGAKNKVLSFQVTEA